AEVVKRTVVIRLDNQLTTDAAADNERPMAMLQKRIGNSFYCEYLRRMFPKASEIGTGYAKSIRKSLPWIFIRSRQRLSSRY
ncbi:MAG: hypothetical protein II903_03280, partial [Spirochaetales bacterium]|nr:hypothetical protein [Spirochaetales bacterium]